MNQQLPSVLHNLSDWEKICEYKHILFDTDAIISIIEFKAQSLLNEFKKINATNCYIHPVYTELLKTNNPTKRIERQSLINEFNFEQLSLGNKDLENATLIQSWLALKQCYPSPTDLYLAGVIKTFKHDNVLIFTGNISDFPYPLFIRKAYLVIQNDKQMKVCAFISINREQLINLEI